jgi:hypothetical protein
VRCSLFLDNEEKKVGTFGVASTAQSASVQRKLVMVPKEILHCHHSKRAIMLSQLHPTVTVNMHRTECENVMLNF